MDIQDFRTLINDKVFQQIPPRRGIPHNLVNSAIDYLAFSLPDSLRKHQLISMFAQIKNIGKENKYQLEISILFERVVIDLVYEGQKNTLCIFPIDSNVTTEIDTFFQSSEDNINYPIQGEIPYRIVFEINSSIEQLNYEAEGDKTIIKNLIDYSKACTNQILKLGQHND